MLVKKEGVVGSHVSFRGSSGLSGGLGLCGGWGVSSLSATMPGESPDSVCLPCAGDRGDDTHKPKFFDDVSERSVANFRLCWLLLE